MSYKIRWAVILSLVLLALLFWQKQRVMNAFTSKKADLNFAVVPVEDISRIFMADKQGHIIDLKKQADGNWMVNNSFPAWASRVDLLLNHTIAGLRIRSTVPQAARNNVLTKMSISGVKVMIYTHDAKKAEKVYYVGGTTPDLLGTYFLMEQHKDPYVLHVPGHDGYVNSRYSLDKDEWISRSVFMSSSSDIRAVSVSYPKSPTASFQIVAGNKGPQLNPAPTSGRSLNQVAVDSYLKLFEQLNFEGYDNTKNQRYIDSLSATQPIAIIRLESKSRGVDELKLYVKPRSERTSTLYDKEGKALTHDADRYYAQYNKIKRLLIVQDYTFGKVLVSYPDFLR